MGEGAGGCPRGKIHKIISTRFGGFRHRQGGIRDGGVWVSHSLGTGTARWGAPGWGEGRWMLMNGWMGGWMGGWVVWKVDGWEDGWEGMWYLRWGYYLGDGSMGMGTLTF